MQDIVQALASIQNLALKPKQDTDKCMWTVGFLLVKDQMIKHFFVLCTCA